MINTVLQWLQTNEAMLWWFGVLSVVMFVGTLILVPILIARIPHDYFTAEHERGGHFRDQHPFIRLFLILGKNVLGVLLFAAGIAMLVLPGQGVLTMLIGLVLIDFPGKYELERRLVAQPAVLKAINWIRNKAGKQPLSLGIGL